MELLKEPRPINAVVLGVLRVVRGVKVTELARCTQVPQNLLYAYEAGTVELTSERLIWLVRMMGFTEPEQVVEEAALYCDALAASGSGMREGESDPVPLPWWERRHITKMSASMAVISGRMTRENLTREFRAIHRKEERKAAEESWKRLKKRSHVERLVAVEVASEFKNWALVVLLCDKSRRAAARSKQAARELAELATRIAELVPGIDPWRQLLRGYAMAHLANAVRVGGDIPSAAAIFASAKGFWKAGEQCDRGLLERSRVLELEASLRRDERNFAAAHQLLDEAEAVGASSIRVALKRAITYEHEGAYDQVAAILDREPPSGCEARDLFAWRFNLAVNLCHLGRYKKAASQLPNVRSLAVDQRNLLDLNRVVWLEGRINRGLGNLHEAEAAFRQAQDHFLSEEIWFDTALISVELAETLLELGKSSEVGELANQLPPLFQMQGLQAEAVAALRLFCNAAGLQRLSKAMACQLIAFFYKARYDKSLRFELLV